MLKVLLSTKLIPIILPSHNDNTLTMKTNKANIREDIKVVTKNDFIKAKGMENASLKAIKLLYIAIAQCKRTDMEFYEYYITVHEFANIMGIDPSNIYKEVDSLTDELMKAFIRIGSDNKKTFKKRTVFASCDYIDGKGILFRLNKEMTDLLLGIAADFSKPLLKDFMKMRSIYSIKIWHYLQMKMKSQKPILIIEGQEPEYYLSVEEIRQITGTEFKFKQICELKKQILDKACREIETCAGIKLEYTNVKEGKKIIGFNFHVVPLIYISKKQADKFEKRLNERKNNTK